MLSPCVRRAAVLLVLLASFLLRPVYAAPSTPVLPRNVTVGNGDPLLQYSPSLCGTEFPLGDPLALASPAPCNGTWITIINSGYSAGSTSSATGISSRFNNVSPSVSFTFAGTAVYWYTTSYPDGRGGLAAVKLDSALPVLINTSSLLPGDNIVFNVLGFAARDLDPDVPHTITVTLVPQPQTAPDAPVSLLDVDAFQYTQVPLGQLTTFSTPPTGTSSPTPSPSNDRDKRGTFTGALIALSVCGSLLVAAVVASSVVFYYRRRRQRQGHNPVRPDSPADDADTIPDMRAAIRAGHARGPSLVGPLISERVRPPSGEEGPSGGYVY